MFRLFKPKCPVEPSQKAWIEYRMAWLCQQFGLERMLNTKMLLPTDERFARFDGTEDSARELFQTMCEILQIPADKIVLEFDVELSSRGAAGLYLHNEAKVTIASSQLDDGQSLVGTIAHELAHQVLMSAGHSTANINDHERATDLFCVYSGFGIFAANSALQDSTRRYGHISWWQIGKKGYLTAVEFGYALAVLLHVRGERAPDWQQFLRLDARATMTGGLKYIDDSGDCLFQSMCDQGTRARNEAELLAALTSKFNGTRVAAIWEVAIQNVTSAPVVRTVTERLSDKNDDVRLAAIATLAHLGPAAQVATRPLIDAMQDSDPIVRAEAARALAEIQLDETTLPHFEKLLLDSKERVRYPAVRAIERYGSVKATTLNQLLLVLKDALISCNFSISETVVSIVSKLSPDPQATLRQFFDNDEELRTLAIQSLLELNEKPREHEEPIPTS